MIISILAMPLDHAHAVGRTLKCLRRLLHKQLLHWEPSVWV